MAIAIYQTEESLGHLRVSESESLWAREGDWLTISSETISNSNLKRLKMMKLYRDHFKEGSSA